MPLNIETREKFKGKRLKTMGMAASQAYFLGLTSRKADIIGQQQRLSNQKMALTRDMRKITQDYNNGLNQKVLKWSNNNGVSYVDLSYKNLMSPSTLNLNKAYLITDLNNRVVVDTNYKKYAEMISPNGKSGGDWSGDTRANILAELTGISASDIKAADTLKVNQDQAHKDLHVTLGEEPEIKGRKVGITGLIKKMGSEAMANGKTWQENYDNNGTIDVSDPGELGQLISQLSNKLSKYFPGQSGTFSEACGVVTAEGCNQIYNKEDLSNSAGFLTGKNGKYKINIKEMVDYIIAIYIEKGGECTDPNTSNSYGGQEQPIWYDVDTVDYKDSKAAHDAWLAEKKAGENSYDNTTEAVNIHLTAYEENLIKFYDEIFSSIADKGWTYNERVNDTDYLNQMLQNQFFTITTVEEKLQYNDYGDPDTDAYGNPIYKNEYESNIASNFYNVYEVSDSDARETAMTEYEYKKSIINQKESRIDLRMQDLSTELSAINQMLQSIESVKNENIERTFGIFG